GVLELGGGAGLALEALDELLVEREGEGQHLDRDVALELLLPGLEDDRHAAAAELLEDFVLVLELVAHHVEIGHLGRRFAPAGDRRGRQVQAAGPAELAGVVVLGAAAGTVHQCSEESGKLRDSSERVSTRHRRCPIKSRSPARRRTAVDERRPTARWRAAALRRAAPRAERRGSAQSTPPARS